MAKVSYRRRFEFWLDEMKPEENELVAFCQEAKQRRGFARSIRHGLRLVQALESGDLTTILGVLRELYPDVAEQLAPTRGNLPSQELLSQIFGGATVIIQQPGGSTQTTNAIGFGTPPKGSGPPRQMNLLDEDEDDTPAIQVKEKEADTSAAENFMKSMGALQGWG